MHRNGNSNTGLIVKNRDVLSSVQLVSCLAGELEVDPALLVETIKEDNDLLHVVRSYGAGDLTYSQVLDTIVSGDYF